MLIAALLACADPSDDGSVKDDCEEAGHCDTSCVRGPEEAIAGVTAGTSTLGHDGTGLTTDGRPATLGAYLEGGERYQLRLGRIPDVGTFADTEMLAILELTIDEDRLRTSYLAPPADLDGDGDDDVTVSVATADLGNEIHWAQGPLVSGALGEDTVVARGPAGAGLGAGALGTVLDWDGNGIAELVFGERGTAAGTVFLLEVPSVLSGEAAFDDTTLAGPEGGYVGWFVEGAEDLDGDGLGDLLVGALDRVLVLASGDGWPADQEDAAAHIEHMPAAARSVGDATGDGHADVVVLPDFQTNEEPDFDVIARLYAGPFDGTIAFDDAVLDVRDGPNVFAPPNSEIHTGIADLEADGRADWILGGVMHLPVPDEFWTGVYRSYRFAGGMCGTVELGDDLPVIESSTYDDYLGGLGLVAIEDIDGDGVGDLAVGSTGTLVGDRGLDGFIFSGTVFAP